MTTIRPGDLVYWPGGVVNPMLSSTPWFAIRDYGQIPQGGHIWLIQRLQDRLVEAATVDESELIIAN